MWPFSRAIAINSNRTPIYELALSQLAAMPSETIMVEDLQIGR